MGDLGSNCVDARKGARYAQCRSRGATDVYHGCVMCIAVSARGHDTSGCIGASNPRTMLPQIKPIVPNSTFVVKELDLPSHIFNTSSYLCINELYLFALFYCVVYDT